MRSAVEAVATDVRTGSPRAAIGQAPIAARGADASIRTDAGPEAGAPPASPAGRGEGRTIGVPGPAAEVDPGPHTGTPGARRNQQCRTKPGMLGRGRHPQLQFGPIAGMHGRGRHLRLRATREVLDRAHPPQPTINPGVLGRGRPPGTRTPQARRCSPWRTRAGTKQGGQPRRRRGPGALGRGRPPCTTNGRRA